jgi:hypothetical protein
VSITTKEDTHTVSLEWASDPINDMIADSIVAVVLQADSSPASVKGRKNIRLSEIYYIYRSYKITAFS